MRELSLRPYHGRLFVAASRKDYEAQHARIFKTPDVLSCAQVGRFCGGQGRDGVWTYLVWGQDLPRQVHELSHVVLHVFERCGIDPREANGEPFCYLLHQLLVDLKA